MSAVTDANLKDIADGQNRPLEAVYPLVFFDALHAKLRRAACTRGPFRTDEAAMKLRFLNALEREVPAGKVVQANLDNHAAHKTPDVRRWLARHPLRTFHFPPTSSSWLNAFEGVFAKLSRRRFKQGVFRSVVDLRATINRFLDEHNETPKPCVWSADPDAIIAVRARGYQALRSNH